MALGALGLLLALGSFGARYHRVEEVGTAERDGYVAEAEQLLDGRIPRDPFRPLLYPLTTAGLARLGIPPFTAARWISNASAVVLVLLAFGFGRRLGSARQALPGEPDPDGTALGLWAALATAVNPNVWILGQHVTTDMFFAALAGGALLASFAYLERPRSSTAALAGLLYGAAAFARANALFLLPGMLAAAVLAWFPLTDDEPETPRKPRWTDAPAAAFGALVLLVPHWLLRATVFGDPFHDENWKNLAWKLHGYPDWSYLDRVPFGGLWDVVASAPLDLLRGGVSELGRFFFGGGLSQLVGTPLHALLLVVGCWAALRVRPRATGWLLFAGGCFLVALAFAFFTWGRLLLVLLPPANALVFAALAGTPGRSLRRRIARGFRWGPRGRFWLYRAAVAVAAGMVALLAVKTFFFRLPAFIERHPTTEIAVLRQLEEGLPPGAALAGVTPFLGRYLDVPYIALPDAFGTEIERPERWFAKVRPLLVDADVRYLVVGAKDLRDRPESLLEARSPVPWLEPVVERFVPPDARQGEVAVWRVVPPSHSARRASAGSMWAARRAGTQVAMRVVRSRRAMTLPKVSGSTGAVSNSRLPSRRVTRNAPTSPRRIPRLDKPRAWTSTHLSTSWRRAPSAIRRPISRLRRATR
jgi:hypothetical protein